MERHEPEMECFGIWWSKRPPHSAASTLETRCSYVQQVGIVNLTKQCLRKCDFYM